MEQTERILGDMVEARVFIEINQGQDSVREEWEKAFEDVKIIENAAKESLHRFLFKLQEEYRSPNWPKDFQITNESLKVDNIRKTLMRVSIFYHPDKLGMNMKHSDRWKYEKIQCLIN